MLKKLRIQNFKCWEDTGTIDMDPITLFFGANSSGKSSIGQFLMMLKQTVQAHDQEAVFYLGGENSVVQLGSYNEIVFKNNLKSNIIFEYQWSPKSPNNGSDLTLPNYPHNDFRGNSVAFEAKVDFSDSKNSPILSISEFEYRLIKDNGDKEFQLGMKRKKNEYSDIQYYVVEAFTPNDPKFKLKQRLGSNPHWIKGEKRIPFYSTIKFYRFPRQVTDIFANVEDFSTKFHYEHEELFSSLFYLGPLRTNNRWYNYQGPPESVGPDGRHTVGAILAARDRNYKIKLGSKSFDSFEALIAFNLKEIGLIEEFNVQQIHQQMYEVKVKTKGSETWVNLSDVGLGVSQVLPLLVQCFYAPERSIILIDQPEVHLHPYAQSALADVMINVIESKRNIQLIIETHSEHFLRRLQRRIAEGKLSEDKIAAYFASINDEVPLARLAKKKKFSTTELSTFKNAGISSANDLATCPIKELIAAYFASINDDVPLDKLAEKKKFPTTELAAFKNAGISSANDLAIRSIKELCEVRSIGETKADKWQKAAKEVPSISEAEAKAKEWQKAAEEYVGEGKEKAQLERLEIDEYGNIQNWPENFFGDEMGDITAQAKAAMEKRMQPHATNVERNK